MISTGLASVGTSGAGATTVNFTSYQAAGNVVTNGIPSGSYRWIQINNTSSNAGFWSIDNGQNWIYIPANGTFYTDQLNLNVVGAGQIQPFLIQNIPPSGGNLSGLFIALG